MKPHHLVQVSRVGVSAAIILGAALVVPFTSHGQTHLLTATATAANVVDLRQWDARVDAMTRTGELRSRGTLPDGFVPSRTHERFDQYYRGVRVWGGDLSRQMDRGVSVSLFGTIYEAFMLSVDPVLSADEARIRVLELSGAVSLGDQPAELLVLPLEDDSFALTYRYQAVAATEAAVYFIDAMDGRLRRKLDLLQFDIAVVQGTGVFGDTKKLSVSSESGTFFADDLLRPPSLRTFDLRGNLNRTIDVLNGVTALTTGDLAADSSTTWTDSPNVDGHTYEGYTYDYYFKRFGRRGLDNRDTRIVGITHPVRLQDFRSAPSSTVGTFYLNAFYCPSCGTDRLGMMVYGEGLPENVRLIVGPTLVGVRNFAGAIDVVAHELTHGVTAFTSRLGSANQPGALNEAFSDIMGTSVEFFSQPIGTGPGKADYLMGEDLTTSQVPGLTRSLQDPLSLGTPDNFAVRFTDSVDNGRIHDNSTIPSHAFYLAIEGGTNRTSGLSVQGVGGANREQIEKVFYRAFTSMLTSNSNFAVARAATIQSARDLYGAGGGVERAVTQAWSAVGVN